MSEPIDKVCSKCKISKPFTSFHNQKDAYDGKRSNCKECRKPTSSNYYIKNKEKLLNKSKEWQKANLDKYRIYNKKQRLLNPVRHKERHIIYRLKNANKIKEYYKKHYRNNKGYYITKSCIRRAKIRMLIPLWANMDKIKEIYKNCPEGYHVDHIIPINNKIVCGLHVENNLQYLTVKENLEKGNKYENHC